MAVTAKFKVSRITPWGVAQVAEDGSVEHMEGHDVTAEVELTPDYANGRNAAWAKATPAGVIRLTISNPAALSQFRLNTPFTVTFEQETA